MGDFSEEFWRHQDELASDRLFGEHCFNPLEHAYYDSDGNTIKVKIRANTPDVILLIRYIISDLYSSIEGIKRDRGWVERVEELVNEDNEE